MTEHEREKFVGEKRNNQGTLRKGNDTRKNSSNSAEKKKREQDERRT